MGCGQFVIEGQRIRGGLAFIEAQLYVPLVPLLCFVWVLVLVVLGSFDLPC